MITALATSARGVEPGRPALPRLLAWPLVRRNALVYRRAWIPFLTGFLEPVFYLFSIGIGVGKLLGPVELNGHLVSYASYVAPGMLAASAMNGAILDATYGIFFKIKYDKLYDSILATPVRPVDVAIGETMWSLLRSGIYGAGFLGVMAARGLLSSWVAVLALPAAILIGLAFAGIGMALTTFMRSWQDFDLIQLAILPMFLFSATFFSLDTYSRGIRWVVECTPLYRGVVLCRELTTGSLTLESLVSVVYLVVLGAVGMTIASRRLDRLLLR